MGDLIQGPWRTVDAATLSKRALSVHLQKSVRTIERWVRDEGMPRTRTRKGHLRFSLREVESWLQDERRAS